MTRIADQDNFYVADLTQGYSLLWVTAAAIAHKTYFRYHFLESAALCHIANRYSAPVHAACVERDGRGVLLCGDSGAGKSSLAFACARAGWTYVTDDGSFVLHAQEDRRVVGNCHMIRFRPSAAELFTEVEGRPLTPRVEGKPSIELDTAGIAGMRSASSAQIDYVVFLNRGEQHAQELVAYSRETAREYMQKHLCGAEELRAQQVMSVERLMSAEVLELRYRGLEWAVGRLERLVRGDG
jgi:serine kinase of HPr protein (carbohydrate metabolism regulator)